METQTFSHSDNSGTAIMVDISNKPVRHREASASGFIRLNETTIRMILENSIKKGDVLTVARIAGIQAAKKTSELIPLCHPLTVTNIEVDTSVEEQGIRFQSRVCCNGPTGVEMEALTAVSVALLSVYDMCKAVDKQMVMENICVTEKIKSDL